MTCSCAPAEPGGLLAALRGVGRAARLMVGQPDYDAYRAHRAATHAGEPVMDRAAFFRDREAARFGAGRGGFRCC